METIDCIKTRRSKRKFLDKSISEETIRTLIDCAKHAPFGGPPIKAPQLVEFIIVKDQEVKGKLALNYQDRQYLKQAPVIIAVCADTAKDVNYKDWEITASLATENILLAVHDLGLGACFVTAFTHHVGHRADRKKLREALDLPDHIDLVALIPVGYPDPPEEIPKKELKEIEEVVHFDRW